MNCKFSFFIPTMDFSSKLFNSSILKLPLIFRWSQKCISILRLYSSERCAVKVELLKNRSILKVEGAESHSFLQDLSTNDINRLDEGTKCVFTTFLNSKGKVLHDAMIYKGKDNNEYWVDCDAASLEALQVHMLMCMRGSQVEIRSAENMFSVWAVFSPKEEDVEMIDLGDNILVCRDPRLAELGLRVVAPVGTNVASKMARLGLSVFSAPVPLYNWLRYKLGVGEGFKEIPYGRYTPWEVNCDYLDGLSSTKGSFVGQEEMLKGKWLPESQNRIMPIFINVLGDDSFPLNTPMEDIDRRKRTPVGFLRGSNGSAGLGLIKMAKAFKNTRFRVGNVIGHCVRPSWWPQRNT